MGNNNLNLKCANLKVKKWSTLPSSVFSKVL